MNLPSFTDRLNVEYHENWRDYSNLVPELNLDSEWRIKILPPWGGALIRFIISYKDCTVSTYFDAHNRLGCMLEPYWEIYPNRDGECSRFLIKESDQLVDAIRESLIQQIYDKEDE